MRAAFPRARVEVWAHDQARRGLKPIVRRVWSHKGVRPLALSTHKYEWSYVYGFVHPTRGTTKWLILPEVNTATMQVALDEFAGALGVGPRKQVVIVVDGAAWHTSPKLSVPRGLHLVPLPACTPEMQPAERLWPVLNEALANESFAGIVDLEGRIEHRCRQLMKQPEYIRRLTKYHWWPDC